MSLLRSITFRFQADKGFEGADEAQKRSGPVQFEKDVDDDPFGLDKFLTDAKKADRSKRSHHHHDRDTRDRDRDRYNRCNREGKG